MSRWYLAGQIADHTIEVRYADRLQIIQCELTPMAPYRLFGIAGSDFIGMALTHQRFNPAVQDAAQRCFTSGPEAPREAHIAEANRFFRTLAEAAQADDAKVTAAVDMFERANGAARVGDVADAVGMNVRTLNRRFTHIVGLSPKVFGQILQINWVVGSLYAGEKATIAQIAHEAGYTDQAHLNRAMQRFFREGPRAFLESGHVAFSTFLGASREAQQDG